MVLSSISLCCADSLTSVNVRLTDNEQSVYKKFYN